PQPGAREIVVARGIAEKLSMEQLAGILEASGQALAVVTGGSPVWRHGYPAGHTGGSPSIGVADGRTPHPSGGRRLESHPARVVFGQRGFSPGTARADGRTDGRAPLRRGTAGKR